MWLPYPNSGFRHDTRIEYKPNKLVLNVYSASAVVDDKVYVIGGNSTEIYDPKTDNWTTGAPPPYPVIEYGATEPYTLKGIGVSTVGMMAPERIYVLSNYNQIYDPENNSWALGAQIPTSLIRFNAAVMNDTLYVMGGIDETYPMAFTGTLWPYYDDTPNTANEQYTPVGYGTPDPTYVLEHTPPKISLLSPLNQTYNESNVPLVFTADKDLNWSGYSLDGQQNATITGNSTIANMRNDLHNVTVYANDTFRNTGSQSITFSVEKPQIGAFGSLSLVAIIIVPVAAVCIVVVGLLAYRKKDKK